MIDASFILLICFVGFMGITFKLGYKKSIQGLDQQIALVSKTVEDALQSLKNAQEKYDHELKYGSLIDNEISEIFKRTHHQIEELKQQAQVEFDKVMQQRSLTAHSQIERLRNEVMTETNIHITNQVIATLKLLFNEHITDTTQKEINENLLNKLDVILQKKEPANNEIKAKKKIVNVG